MRGKVQPRRRLLVWCCTVLFGVSLMNNQFQRNLLQIVVTPDDAPFSASSAPLALVVQDNRLNLTKNVDGLSFSNQDAGRKSQLARNGPDVRTPFRKISMLIILKGEMANHLSLVAHAYTVKREMEQYLAARGRSIEIELIGEHQNVEKWTGVRKNLQLCFPHFFRHFDFEGGIWNSAHRRHIDQQEAWLQLQRHGDNITEIGLLVDPHWQSAADQLLTLLDEQDENPSDPTIQELSPASSTLSLPFLTSSVVIYPDELIEKYYDELRDLFRFNDNDSNCCNQLPLADETVLHVRNYRSDLLPQGFHLMDANQTAHKLLKNLPVGHRIALVAPHFGDERDNKVLDYQTALKAKGLSVRMMQGQSSTQDFCFLRRTHTELIGAKTSTYAIWAGLLGNATRVRLYVMDSKWTRNAKSSLKGKILEHYQWKRKDLLDRIRFETYKGDDSDDDKVHGS